MAKTAAKKSPPAKQPTPKKSSDSSPAKLLDQISESSPAYLVWIRLGYPPSVEEHASSESLQQRIRELVEDDDSPGYLLIFQGSQHKISTGPYRYLLTADGDKIPLFTLPDPDQAEEEPSGYLGEPLPESDGDEDGADDEDYDETVDGDESETPIPRVFDSDDDDDDEDVWEEEDFDEDEVDD